MTAPAGPSPALPGTAAIRPLAIGCMRLSTAPDRDEARALAVLHAAFEAGVTLLDTADAYGRDETEIGHNERLVARALATWSGDRSRVRIATKGGLTRPGGRWVPNGRARHLVAACEASRRALGVERIDLYQLHAPDPRVPLETSVRALAALQRDGWIAEIGLCNVSLTQLRRAMDLAPIASVQVELNPWKDAALRGGLVEHCAAHGILVLAHRPLGGTERLRRLERDASLRAIAERHSATPAEVSLAWLRALAPVVVPLPGPTRAETVRSIARAATLTFDEADREALDSRFPAGRLRRGSRPKGSPAGTAIDSEVVLIMGMPGAGKSSLAEELASRGYTRLNRDELGGRLRDLLPVLEGELASGRRRVVLDNTYATRAARNEVLEVASAHGVPVRCLWLTTPLADAQVNVARRTLAGLTSAAVQALRPDALYRYQRELEPPEVEEGFTAVRGGALRAPAGPHLRRPRPGVLARWRVAAEPLGGASPGLTRRRGDPARTGGGDRSIP